MKMGVKFNADEVFQLAERIEQNGEKFYKKAAESNPDSKDILLKLAGMEADHYRTFKALHAEISAKEAEPLVFDPNDETGQYLSAMADGSVFDTSKDPSASLTGRESVSDVLRTAIGLEKDSIVFYLGLKDMVAKPAGKDRIAAIIKEEMEHIRILSGLLA
jgi:rubrerythrin